MYKQCTLPTIKTARGPKKASAYLSYSHLKMKSALLLLALAAVSRAYYEDIYKKFLRSMDVYNFRMKCWGEKNVVKLSVGIEMAKKKCMQMVEEEDVPRSKRQVEELKEFQETNEEFILQYADFQDDLGTMMGNLSCVLKTVQWLQDDGEVNLEPWTTGLIEPPEGGFEFDVEGAAATDLAWRERMSNAATECHELAEAVPAKVLLNDPTSMVLGHAAVFFKCMNVSYTSLKSYNMTPPPRKKRGGCVLRPRCWSFWRRSTARPRVRRWRSSASPTTSTPPLASLPGSSPTQSRLRRGSSTSSCGSSMTTFEFFL